GRAVGFLLHFCQKPRFRLDWTSKKGSSRAFRRGISFTTPAADGDDPPVAFGWISTPRSGAKSTARRGRGHRRNRRLEGSRRDVAPMRRGGRHRQRGAGVARCIADHACRERAFGREGGRGPAARGGG